MSNKLDFYEVTNGMSPEEIGFALRRTLQEASGQQVPAWLNAEISGTRAVISTTDENNEKQYYVDGSEEILTDEATGANIRGLTYSGSGITMKPVINGSVADDLSVSNTVNVPAISRTGRGYVAQKLGELIPNPGIADSAGFFFPDIINASEIRAVDPNFPTKFDLIIYISSDHSSGNGGIYMYLHTATDDFSDGWVSYDDALAAGDFDYLASKPSGNPIYVDTQYGDQTETPCVNVVDGVVFMSYHNRGNEYQTSGFVQNTCLAKSSDGVRFTRYSVPGMDNGVMLAVNIRYYPGNGHTGYFRWSRNDGLFPEIAETYVGFSLVGGGETSLGAFWVSDDAENWSVVSPISTDWSTFNSDTYFPGATIPATAFDPREMRLRSDGYLDITTRIKQSGQFDDSYKSSIVTSIFDQSNFKLIAGVNEFITPGDVGEVDENGSDHFRTIEYKGGKYAIYSSLDDVNGRTLNHALLSDSVASFPEIPNELSRAVYDFRELTALPSIMSLQNSAGSIAFDANGANITVGAGVTSGIVVDVPVDLSTDDVDFIVDNFYQDNTEAVQIRIGLYDADDIDSATNYVALVGNPNTSDPSIICSVNQGGVINTVVAGPEMGYGTSFTSNFKESPQAFKTLGIRHRPSESDTRMTYFDRWRIGFPAEAQTMPSGSYKLIFSIKNNGSNDATVTIGGIEIGVAKEPA